MEDPQGSEDTSVDNATLTFYRIQQAKKILCHEQNNEISVEGCPAFFDKVSCWPPTPRNTLAVIPCLEELNGIYYDTTQNATKFCFENDTWHRHSNYSECRELYLHEESVELEITTSIYFIGYTVSLFALTIAFYIFWKYKELQCLRNIIHMNLMATYILADFMWVFIYITQTIIQGNQPICIVTTILLHYFHLTNFFWMFVEGLYLFMLVVKTFSSENIRLRTYALLGWGGPFVFVVPWGIAKCFVLPEEDEQMGRVISSCPWPQHSLDWIFQAPAFVILIVNLGFLVIIMWVLIMKLQSANNQETQQYLKAAKALLVLIPLLGVTYIVVIVGPSQGISKVIYDNIRAVLLSIQGFSVAVFYCFLNGEVKNSIRHHVLSWNTRRTLGSRRHRYGSTSRDWALHARESFRLYKKRNYHKRGSTRSDSTSTTVVFVGNNAVVDAG